MMTGMAKQVTRVVKPPAARTWFTAAETRAKAVKAGRVLFARRGFDHVGVRELADAADIDPSIIIRVAGSKENLFREIAETTFRLEAPFDGPIKGLGLRIAKLLMGDLAARGANELALLAHSAASPTAGPILAAELHAQFITPLSRHFGGKEAALRAALLTSCVLGFVTMRAALKSDLIERAPRARVVARLGKALQACVD
jgi:AcrR family transcriptional regulator